MSQDLQTPQAQAWTDELQSVGKVRINSSMNSLVWRVGLAIVMIAVFTYIQYSNGSIGQRGLTLAIVGFALLLGACVLFVRLSYGGKSLEIDHQGATMVDGTFIPWTDITSVTVYNDPRSASSVQVNLTDSAWKTHIDSQGGGGKLMNKMNKTIVRDNALLVPSYLSASPQELALWMNTLAEGKTPI